MAKRVAPRGNWIKAPHIVDAYSVSGCISENFANYIPFWKHNGFWLFDSVDVIREVSVKNGLDLAGVTFFYYEALEQEFDGNKWVDWNRDPSFPADVISPAVKHLEGFDVVTFYVGSSPECSPLSCNALADDVATNEHCLFRTLDDAKFALESGKFKDCEPGPYRIFAVYSVDGSS